MPLPDTDSLSNAGGALVDYSPQVDPTTDRSAAGVNVGLANATAATHTVFRTSMLAKWNGTGAPTILFHDEVWNNGQNVGPTIQRTGVGQGIIVYANGASGGTVVDEIGSQPGGNANPHTVNLQAALAMSAGGPFLFAAGCSAPNVVGINIYSCTGASAGVLVDPVGEMFSVWSR